MGNMADSCGGACGSRAHLSATRLGGLVCLRLAHLSVWVVSLHAPSKGVFQNNKYSAACYAFGDALEFFSCFGSNLNPRR